MSRYACLSRPDQLERGYSAVVGLFYCGVDRPHELDAADLSDHDQSLVLRVFDGTIEGFAPKLCFLPIVAVGWVLFVELVADQFQVDRAHD